MLKNVKILRKIIALNVRDFRQLEIILCQIELISILWSYTAPIVVHLLGWFIVFFYERTFVHLFRGIGNFVFDKTFD